MFEQSFKRPRNYFLLSPREQWVVDKELGILDWDGKDLTREEQGRYVKHYQQENNK
jgi:hypothetical protein